MRPIRSQRTGPNGDCVRACLASLFNQKLEDVPDFTAMEDDGLGKYPVWYLEMQSWLKQRGYCHVEMALTPVTPLYPAPYPPLVLMYGETKGGVRHCVVGKIQDLELIPVWNPDPLAQMTGVQALGLLVPLDASRMEPVINNKIISLS